MLSIYICEDDTRFLNYVKKEVEKYAFSETLAIEIACAVTSPDMVLSHLINHPPVAGLYFLDLDLKCEMNGIRLAEAIRKHDPRGFIVFITNDVDSYKLIFKHRVEALDYIEKSCSDLQRRIHECLKDVVKKFTSKATPMQDNILLELYEDVKGLKGYKNDLAKDSLVAVSKAKILCFMTEPEVRRAVILYTTDGDRMMFCGTLKQIEAELDDKRFYRCQKNLLVNLNEITAIDPIMNEVFIGDDCIMNIPYRQTKKLIARAGKDKIKTS